MDRPRDVVRPGDAVGAVRVEPEERQQKRDVLRCEEPQSWENLCVSDSRRECLPVGDAGEGERGPQAGVAQRVRTALDGLPTAWGVVEGEWPSCLVIGVISS